MPANFELNFSILVRVFYYPPSVNEIRNLQGTGIYWETRTPAEKSVSVVVETC